MYRKLYNSWEEPKKSGGVRPFDDPQGFLKVVQTRINERYLQRIQVHFAAKGGIRGRTRLQNVLPHVGKLMVAKFDIENFFGNIKPGMVYDLFIRMGCSPEVARLLTRLTTFKGRVPQGAPTSTMIANLLAGYGGNHSFFGRIENLATDHGGDVTIWVDDVTVSGTPRLRNLESTVGRIGRQCGLKLNSQKSVFLPRNVRQKVTGYVVNDRPNVSKEERRRIRAQLHRCRVMGPTSVCEDSVLKLKSHLRGKIANVMGANPDQGKKFLRQFNAIAWPK
jgi:hypothetical protein